MSKLEAMLRVRIPPVLKGWVAELAEREGRSINSQFIRLLITAKAKDDSARAKRAAK